MNSPSIADRLAAHSEEWAALPSSARAILLRACLARIPTCAEEWVTASCCAKGLDPNEPRAGEEWISGPAVTGRHLRLYARTLESASVGAGFPGTNASSADSASPWIQQVFPQDLFDRAMFPGLRAELHCLSPSEWAAFMAVHQRNEANPPGVAVVLGAGNIQSIPPLDALAMLLLYHRVTVVKLNPVNAYLLDPLRHAFAPLIERSFLEFTAGDLQFTHSLLHHPAVDHVHLTGSDSTYDSVVWGSPADPPDPDARAACIAARKARGERTLDKTVTAELGAVTPALIVPGRWGKRDLVRQARNLVGMVTHNASFNCNAVKLLMTARGWPQREAFLDAFRAELAATPVRQAWYPGAHERWQSFVDHYPQAEFFPHQSAELPWTFIPDVPCAAEEMACRQEAFCGVVAETALDLCAPEDFLPAATAAANVHVQGTLSAVIIAPPHAPRHALDQALHGLRYGAIGVNVWGGLAFGLGQTSWGAWPGHSPEEIGSGVGVVHNTTLTPRVAKSVVYGSFRPLLKWVWDPRFKRLLPLGQRWLDFEVRPGLVPLLRLAWHAVRG